MRSPLRTVEIKTNHNSLSIEPKEADPPGQINGDKILKLVLYSPLKRACEQNYGNPRLI